MYALLFLQNHGEGHASRIARTHKARQYLQWIRLERPDYCFNDVSNVYRFQKKKDTELIRKAFTDMRAIK